MHFLLLCEAHCVWDWGRKLWCCWFPPGRWPKEYPHNKSILLQVLLSSIDTASWTGRAADSSSHLLGCRWSPPRRWHKWPVAKRLPWWNDQCWSLPCSTFVWGASFSIQNWMSITEGGVAWWVRRISCKARRVSLSSPNTPFTSLSLDFFKLIIHI